MRLLIDDISKSYGSIDALQHFSVSMVPGIYALLGPNGSGKSTLINIISGNLKADTGTISYIDEYEKTISINDYNYRSKLGYMPQYIGLYLKFTVEEFMLYIASLKSIDKTIAKQQISELLTIVELDNVRKQKIGTLSGGMKQRLTFAQAVLGTPELIILDEPTAGLDSTQRIAIRNYISKIAFNKIVIIATHVVSDIEYIARNIIMLKKGVIIDNAPPHELTKKIEDKVWTLSCKEAEVQRMQESYRVINISRDEESGNILLRVLSDERPDVSAKTAVPTLEDYYLYVFDDVHTSTE